MKLHIIVLLFVLSTYAENVEEKIEKTYVDETLRFLGECGGFEEFTICFKEKALRYVGNLPSSLVIGGGFSIKPNEGGTDRSARVYNIPELPEEPRTREDAIDKILADRILNYLASHTIEFKVPDAAISEFKRSIEEGRKKKRKNNMLPLLMLFKLKLATLTAIAVKTLAIVAFKALIIAKIALTLAITTGLKKLAEGKHHSASYEVIAHDDHHGHYRSLGQGLAYRAYKEVHTGNKNS